jgi:hypothetical protein
MKQTQITITVILAFIGFAAFCLINSSCTDNNNGNLYFSLLGAACVIACGTIIYKGSKKQ